MTQKQMFFDEDDIGMTKVYKMSSEEDDTDEIMKRISDRIAEEEGELTIEENFDETEEFIPNNDEDETEDEYDDEHESTEYEEEEYYEPVLKRKKKNSNKAIKITLAVVMVILVLAIVGAGMYLYMTTKPKVTMIDLKERSKEFAENWCFTNKESVNCLLGENYSEDIPAGKLISQSVAAGETVEGDVRIQYSLGPDPYLEFEIPDITKMTLFDLKNWFTDNKFSSVIYEYVESEEPKDKLLSINVTGKVQRGSSVIVKVSSGPKKEEEKKTDEKETSKYVSVPSTLSGLSEKEFTTAIEKLGLTPSRLKTCNFSTTIDEDYVFDYESGQYEKGDKVNYSLSCGPYKFDKDDYNGLSESRVKEIAQMYNDRNAHISLRLVEVKDVNIGKTYDCADEKEGIYDNITCKFGVASDNTASGEGGGSSTVIDEQPGEDPKPAITVSGSQYVGKTANEFESIVRGLGLVPNHDSGKDDYSDTVAEGLVVWHGSGTYVENESIRYGVSKGKKASDPPVTPEKEKAYLPATNVFESMVYNNAEEAETALKNGVLGKFTNVSYFKSATQDYSAGAIYDVKLNGGAYDPGYYDIDSDIIVYISTGY